MVTAKLKIRKINTADATVEYELIYPDGKRVTGKEKLNEKGEVDINIHWP